MVKTMSLSCESFATELAALIASVTGNRFGPEKRSFVLSKLQQRVSQLGLADIDEYREIFLRQKSLETEALISLMTTHHTYFFREQSQFKRIHEHLPDLVKKIKSRGQDKLRVWSAGCSSGEEVYSLAMFLSHHLPTIDPEIGLEIVGTDIDSESLDRAINGVYLKAQLKEVPLRYVSKNWEFGQGEISEFIKASDSLYDVCRFRKLNLVKPEQMLGIGLFDIIFCRNVFIYFEENTINTMVENMLRCLHVGGFLAVGASETLTHARRELVHRENSIFQKLGRDEQIKKNSASKFWRN